MASNDPLFELISSLNSSEKRYFRVFAGNSNKKSESKYIDVFEAISKQRIYDEAKLIKKFGYTENPNGFAVAKNYLFQLVLKSLKNYGSDSVTIQFWEWLIEIEILYRRKIYKSAYKIVQKALKVEEVHARKEAKLLFLQWEYSLAAHLYKATDFWKKQVEILDQVKDVAIELRTNSAVLWLYKKAHLHNLTHGVIKKDASLNDFVQLARHPLLEDPAIEKNPLANIYAHHFYITYFEGLGKNEEKYQWNRRLLQLFLDNPEWNDSYFSHFLNSIVLTLSNQLEIGLFEDFEKEISLLKNFKIKEGIPYLSRRKEFEILFLMSRYYSLQGKFEELIQDILPQVNTYFEKIKNINRKDEFWLLVIGAWANLAVGNPDEALQWTIDAEQKLDKHLMVDMFIFTRIIALCIHYELKNYTVIDSYVKSTKRYLKNKEKLHPFEMACLNFFNKLSPINADKKSRRILLEKFQQDIYNIDNFKFKNSFFIFQEISWWVESKISNKTISEIAKSRHIFQPYSTEEKTTL